MGHVHLLEISHLDQVVGQWLHLRIGQSALDEVKSLNWGHLEQVSQDLTRELVVIAVKLGNLALLDLVDECLATVVVDFVVL